MNRPGVLLVNLGSPDSPTERDVRKYLREFLMDGRVLDVPGPLRFAIVRLGILPRRSATSAAAYRQIWLPEGSPLVAIGKKVQQELQRRVNLPVELAMRYQNPSIAGALRNLQRSDVSELLLIPLFPHYAMSSYETAVQRVQELARKLAPAMSLKVVPPYFDEPGYITALVGSAAEYLQADYDHLLFSFHGLPERHLRKTDPTGCHCLQVPNCCDIPHRAHRTCYRAQCFKTTRAFARQAGVPEEKYSVAFQSRLGRDPWLAPYTDQELVRLAQAGVKKLRVICPAFVADCLETLEEIGVRGKETFLRAGGRELELIPCLNAHPLWLAALEAMIAEGLGLPNPDREAAIAV